MRKKTVEKEVTHVQKKKTIQPLVAFSHSLSQHSFTKIALDIFLSLLDSD